MSEPYRKKSPRRPASEFESSRFKTVRRCCLDNWLCGYTSRCYFFFYYALSRSYAESLIKVISVRDGTPFSFLSYHFLFLRREFTDGRLFLALWLISVQDLYSQDASVASVGSLSLLSVVIWSVFEDFLLHASIPRPDWVQLHPRRSCLQHSMRFGA